MQVRRQKSLVSGVVCCSRETDDEVFMTRGLDIRSKTTKQNLIVRSSNFEAETNTVINDCTRGVVLLKLTEHTESIARPLCESRATCYNRF